MKILSFVCLSKCRMIILVYIFFLLLVVQIQKSQTLFGRRDFYSHGDFYRHYLQSRILMPTINPTINPEHASNYVTHPRRTCSTNNITGRRGVDFQECKRLCNTNSRCVAFVYYFRRSSSWRNNCYVKDLCENVVDNSEATLYIKMNEGCTFDATESYALYGNNEKTLYDATLTFCKSKCLEDKSCLSFDHIPSKNACFLSQDSRETAPSYFGKHDKATYYHKRCSLNINNWTPDDEESEEGSNGGEITFEDGYCSVIYGPVGGSSGTTFSDRDVFQHTNVTAIYLNYARYVRCIGLRYGQRSLGCHGVSTGTQVGVTLEEDEFITGVEGRAGNYIDKISFITNRRTIGPFGADGGESFSVQSNGKQLLYISGWYTNAAVATLYFHFSC